MANMKSKEAAHYKTYVERLRAATQVTSCLFFLSLCLSPSPTLDLSVPVSPLLSSPLQVWTYSPTLDRYLRQAIGISEQRSFVVPLWNFVDTKSPQASIGGVTVQGQPQGKCVRDLILTIAPPVATPVHCRVNLTTCIEPASAPCPLTEVVFFGHDFKFR
jgi:hypothetical protein